MTSKVRRHDRTFDRVESVFHLPESDPLTEVIALLRPRTVFSKRISGAGAWAIRYAAYGHPSFCTVLEGGCLLAVEGAPAITLQAGDFVLLPSTPSFVMSDFHHTEPVDVDPEPGGHDEVRHGRQDGPPDMLQLGGYFLFDSPDPTLLASVLPTVVHVRAAERLTTLVQLVGDESRAHRPGRDLVLTRLVEGLLIQALRATP